MQQSLKVRTAPVGAFSKHESATGKELEDVVTRLENLLLERFAAAYDVTYPLVTLARNSHCGELTRSIKASKVSGISPVVFSLDAWPFWNE